MVTCFVAAANAVDAVAAVDGNSHYCRDRVMLLVMTVVHSAPLMKSRTFPPALQPTNTPK